MKQHHAPQSGQDINLGSSEIKSSFFISENVSAALKVINSRNSEYSYFQLSVIPAIQLLGKEGGVEAIPALEALYKRCSKFTGNVGEEIKDKSPIKDLQEVIKAVTLIGHREAAQVAIEALREMLPSAKNVIILSNPFDLPLAPWKNNKDLKDTDIPLIARALATFGSAAESAVADLKKHLDDPIYGIFHYEEEKGGLAGKLGSPTRPVFEINDVSVENQKNYQRHLLRAIRKISPEA